MQRFSNHWLLLVLLVLTPALLTGCDTNDNVETATVLDVDEDGYTRFNQTVLADILDALPKEGLSEAETAHLLFMREEEKLARDVYLTLDDQWNQSVFDHLAESEETHAQALLLLIDKYELTDLAAGDCIGMFLHPELQALYDLFVTQGEVSLMEALKAGAAIEEMDLRDLQLALDQHVDNQDITLVYEHLMRGSRNHLRAFVRNLSRSGVPYVPQYLSQSQYDSIIGSPIERG